MSYLDHLQSFAEPHESDDELRGYEADIHRMVAHRVYIYGGHKVIPYKAAAWTLFKAYFRSIHGRSAGYGGLAFVHSPAFLDILRAFIEAWWEIKGLHWTHETGMTFTNRSDPVAHALLTGVPVDSNNTVQGWDLCKLFQCVPSSETIIFTAKHPLWWIVLPTAKGQTFDVCGAFEVVDLHQITARR